MPRVLRDGPAQSATASHDAVRRADLVLLGTKLHPPGDRRELVRRPRLVARFAEHPLPRLIVLSAPPGAGKTTLLAEWSATDATRSFAWLSLDRGDNDPVVFWRYAAEALRAVVPGVGSGSLGYLAAPAAELEREFLPALINELAAASGDAVLVLDDFHVIRDLEIHRAVDFLVERLPPGVCVALATRADPPLALARLRARRDLVEVRAAELRFSDAEVAALLNENLALDLSPEDLVTLSERTEGWVAGLQLAALSLRDRRDRTAHVAAFAGTDRHIVDYLGSEVLGAQREEITQFLLRTSILERLCGPVCDAVLGTRGSAGLLAEIERENLFLIPLDSRREWYRYHHLFGALLRAELARVAPDEQAGLHRRAAGWYGNEGLVPEAVHHATEAGDLDEVGELVARHWNDLVNQGRLATVDAWLETLGEERVAADPRLALARAGTSLTMGRREEVDPWLDLAEAGSGVAGELLGGTSVPAEAAIYRAVHSYMSGDVGRALDAARRAVDLEREDDSPWAAMAQAALGRALVWRDEPVVAERALDEAVRLAQPPRNNLSVIGALGYLALIRADQQRWDDARELAARAIEMSEEHGLAEHWVTMIPLAGRARVAIERGELEAADSDASRAGELGRRGAGRLELAFVLCTLAEVRQLRRDPAGARAALEEAEAAAEACPDPGRLADVMARTERVVRRPAKTIQAGDELTDRELAVLRYLPRGLSLREIGDALFVSQNTVKTHVRGIYRKLDASSRGDAVDRARELGLLDG